MNKLVVKLAALAAFCTLTAAASAQTPAPGPGLLMVRSTGLSPADVVEAVKEYSVSKNWLYLGASKAKQGEVTMVKFCIPQVGQVLWPLGLQLSALLPCGNVGVYQKQGKTEVSMLHPAYMHLLYPDPQVEKAVAIATPLLTEMLDTIVK